MSHFRNYLLSLTIVGTTHAQFVDVSLDAGLFTDHVSGYLGQGVSVVDVNGDFIDDVTFAHSEGDIRGYLGDGMGGFEAFELELEGAQDEDAKMVLWADVDNDGDQDLLVTFRMASNKLYLNDGMLNLTLADAGLRQDEQRSYGASFGDYNNDGFLDLFIANYSNSTTPNPVNELYLNLGMDSDSITWLGFEDVGQTLGLEAIEGYQSFQGHWVDFDDNGDLDLHVIRDRVDFENQLFKFTDTGLSDIAPDVGLNVSMNCMSTSVADFDCDLDDDVYLSGLANVDSNMLMVNDGNGQFQVIEGDGYTGYLQPNGRTSWAANWLDVDNNGWEDLHVAVGTTAFTDMVLDENSSFDLDSTHHDGFFMNTNGEFEPDTSDLFLVEQYYAFSTATGDFNRDGFPDLISHRAGSTAQVLQGIPNGNTWIKFDLRGTESNSNAVGARIIVHADGHAQTRMVFAGENYLGQNSYTQHFGMGSATIAEEVLICWPAGDTTMLNDLPLNTHYLMVENGELQILYQNASELGCTYSEACNFNPNASQEDGTCDFTCLYASLCGEGTVWDNSVGACVGLQAGCPGDLNNNGAVDIADLLEFLASFGSICGN